MIIISISSLELFYITTQIIFAGMISSWGIFIGTLIALFFFGVCNLVTYFVHHKYTKEDNSFKHWLAKYKVMAVAVPVVSLCMNFKMIRLFYCKFFNLPYFNAQFEKPDMFYKPLTYITVLSILVYLTPLIIVDIIAFFNIDWGFQLLIN